MPSPIEVSVPEGITIFYAWGPPGGAQVGRGLNDLQDVDYDNSITEHPRRQKGPDGGTYGYKQCYQVNETQFVSYIFQHGWQNAGRYRARRKGDDLSEHPRGYIPRGCYPMTIFLIGGWAPEETEEEY